MKILWFTNTPCSASEKLSPGLNRGGWLSSLEKALVRNENIELHVAFYYTEQIEPFIYNNTWFYPIKRNNSGSKIQRYFLRLLRKENNDLKEIKDLLEIANQVNPDLIHVHGTEDNFGLIQYYIKTPVVVSIQGILSPIVEKFFSGIPQNIASKYNSLKNRILVKSFRYSFKSLKQKAIRERQILKISQNIIGRTDWDKRVTNILAPKSKYFIGQEMLRTSFYTNVWKKKQFGKKIRIVTVSSNGISKGFETILKTASNLCDYVGFDFEWLVVGLDKKSEVVLVTEKWLKMKFNNFNINLVGEKNEIEIVDLLLSADIYCQVSHIENSPNSLCEAMILGIPTIASFAGGTSSILENGKEGVLVQDGDPYVLSGAILELSSAFETATNYSNNAKIRAAERHDKKKIVSDLSNVYQSIINQNI